MPWQPQNRSIRSCRVRKLRRVNSVGILHYRYLIRKIVKSCPLSGRRNVRPDARIITRRCRISCLRLARVLRRGANKKSLESSPRWRQRSRKSYWRWAKEVSTSWFLSQTGPWSPVNVWSKLSMSARSSQNPSGLFAWTCWKVFLREKARSITPLMLAWLLSTPSPRRCKSRLARKSGHSN